MKSKKRAKIIHKERLAKRTVQIIGFGFAGVLLVIRIYASIKGYDSGISEFLIAGFVGVGVSAEFRFKK